MPCNCISTSKNNKWLQYLDQIEDIGFYLFMCEILLIYFEKKRIHACVSAYFKALFFQNFRMRAHGSKVFLATNSGYQYSNVSKSLRIP